MQKRRCGKMYSIVEIVVGIAFIVVAGIAIFQAIQKKRNKPVSGSHAADFYFPNIFPIRQLTPNITISAATIVEPTGVENRMETTIPNSAQNTEITVE